jgi:ABC-type transporter Mla subunit MlaD
MRATARHTKLGVLAVLTLFALFAAVFGLAVHRRPIVMYHTYFNESVQGLDEGAIVKFRGVKIGKVATIEVAQDRRLIDVGLAIDKQQADRLRLDTTALSLRSRLTIYGITGVKLIDLDFADAETPKPPMLAFPPDRHYIPSRPSLLGSVEDDLVAFVHRLPRLVDDTRAAIGTVEEFTRHARQLVEDARGTVSAVEGVARRVIRADVAGALGKTLAALNEFSQRTASATTDAEETLRDVGDAARSFRDFIDALEREPDMILKGRAVRGRRR